MATSRVLPGSDFEQWVRPHLVAMRRLAALMTSAADSDDVVQDALTRAWSRWADFDPERGTPAAWLLMLTADRARAFRRRHKPFRALVDVDDQPVVFQPADMDLRAAIRALPRRQREVIVLFYYGSLTTDEIGAALRVSPGTVKSTLHDARKKLALALEDHDDTVR